MRATFSRRFAFAALAACSPALAAQQPGRQAPAALDFPALRRAVVTILALDGNGRTLASGTGFFITEGYILTAAHVLTGASACNIELSDQQRFRCSVAASDTAKDVAMLMVPGTPPATLRWGSSEGVRDGDEVIVISNPLGELPGTVSKGIVSASRVVRGTKLLQISAPISHGSSGGPVLNTRGQVIGIVRSTIEAGQALNFATATDAIRNLNNDPTAVAEGAGLLQAGNTARAPAGSGAVPPRGTSASGLPTINVGQSVTGTLTASDSLYPDDTYFKMYQFTIPNTGRAVTIDVSSDDFDALVIVRGDDLAESIINDDGGPGCAARVSQVFPGRGPYRILVNTTTSPTRQTGRYTLSLTEGMKPVQERGGEDCTGTPSAGDGGQGAAGGGASEGRSIIVGQTVQGRLSTDDVLLRADSTYAQAWAIQGRAGQTVTIDLESDDFDAYLFLRGPGISQGREVQDDDSGGNCHARLTATFPQSGEYEVVVNTSGRKYATGSFTLSVTSGSKPKSVARCSP